jgi:hypothetical protein
MPLEDWIAKPNDDFTKVVEPIYIDYRLIEELVFYHPAHPDVAASSMKLVLDDTGRYARVALPENGSWNPKWAEVYKSLRFEPQTERSGEILRDISGDKPTFGPSEWSIKDWRIVKTRDSRSRNIQQEVITWTARIGSSDVEAISSYSWLPYEPKDI